MSVPVTVLYIAAHSRSGSTLLDRMLGQIDGFTSLGEVRHLWRRGLVAGEPCGCGTPLPQCPFWNDVLQRAFGGMDEPRARGVASQLREVDRVWRIGGLAWARHRTTGRGPALRSVLDTLGSLYHSIHDVSRAPVLVDSSKVPSYGVLLSLIPGIRLHVLHLIRDSRGVAYSRLRRNAQGKLQWKHESMLVARTGLEWAAVNGLSWALTEPVRYTRIKYEHLVSDPVATLQRIASICGQGAPRMSFVESDRVLLQPNHTVSGNEMRFARGWLTLREDREWEQRLRRRHAWLVNAMTWPWLKRYGYL